MALRGKKPVEGQKRRLKLLLFGPAGVGKTIAALMMPRPYVIDTEAGTEHYGKQIEAVGGAVFSSNDFDDVVSEVGSLLTEKHPFRTLVIDSFTPLFETEIDKGEAEVGTEWGRHIAFASKPSKRLFNKLSMLDMNCVVTAHSKAQYVILTNAKGDKEMTKVGETFDGWKKLDYLFDLVLELQRRGTKRIAVVRKTRLAEFPDQAEFEWSFDELARRYGAEHLEREAEVIELASPDQVARLRTLIVKAGIDKETVDKLLAKANADSLDEMTPKTVATCIAWAEGKIKQAKELEAVS